jgi:hypothetical protein
MYSLEEGKENPLKDTQLFVTGAVMSAERPEVACARILHDKVRMLPKNGKLRHVRHYSDKSRRGILVREANWYACKIADLEPSPSSDSCHTGDFQRNKVGCILHGTYKDILDLFARIPIADVAIGGVAGVAGVVGVQVSDVKNILKNILQCRIRHEQFFQYHVRSSNPPACPNGVVSEDATIAFYNSLSHDELVGAVPRSAVSHSAVSHGAVSHCAVPVPKLYCEDLECLLFAEPDSLYCKLHQAH